MGVDICHNKNQKVRCKESKSQDVYLRLLVKLYRFLARGTNSTFNQVVLKRWFMSRTNQPPLSLSRMIQKMKLPGREGNTTVLVGTLTDDVRVQEGPRLKVHSLHVSSRAQSCNLKPRRRASPSTAYPGLPQGLWHCPALWSLQGPSSVQAFPQGSWNPTQ